MIAIQSASHLAHRRFRDDRTRATLAGAAAHSMVPLDYASTAGYGLGLIVAAHSGGWPVARGGSQQVANAGSSAAKAWETGHSTNASASKAQGFHLLSYRLKAFDVMDVSVCEAPSM